MRIHLFRHGPAEERDPIRWPDDAERPLTTGGAERTRRALAGQAWLEPGLSLVISSPFVRARQTAEIAHEVCAVDTPIEFFDALVPGGDPKPVLRRLERLGANSSVLVVGHEPDLGRLAALLLSATGRGPAVTLKKAGLCVIAFDGRASAGQGQLAAFLAPRILRRLARGRD